MAGLRPTYTHARAASYARAGGPWDVPGLDEVLTAASIEVVDGSARLSADALEAAVASRAGWLRSQAVGPGDVVAWQLPNGLDAYLLYRACWRLGAVAAPVHHAAGPADVKATIEQVRPALVVSAGAGLGTPVGVGSVDADTLAVVLFTSGSSGRPKAVLHTHRGLVYKARTMTAVHGLSGADAVIMPAPLAHISGLLNGVLVPGVAGMKTVLMSRWEPDRALSLIAAEGVTFMIGPPTFFVSLMDAPGFGAERVAPLRLVSSGGAGVTPAFVARAASTLECTVKRTYGSTEVPTVTTSTASDPPDKAATTDGRATGEAEVRIVDGEVQLRGPEVFVGYVDADLTTAAFTDDGWFRTGDLGLLDPEGWLTITGRMKDVIIRGGENITASEVEAALEAHPVVLHAAAVGYPDERLGQRVCAFVVASGPFDLEACRAWMESRGVTRFKWPERVVQVPSLPLLAAGKIDRAALERLAAQ